jgi:hypothetical protein
MFGDMNLLGVYASQENLYITRLTSILFTKDELKRGLIKDNNSNLTREDFDKDKVELIKQAYFAKYRLTDAEEKENAWQKIKSIVNRKCYVAKKQKTNGRGPKNQLD